MATLDITGTFLFMLFRHYLKSPPSSSSWFAAGYMTIVDKEETKFFYSKVLRAAPKVPFPAGQRVKDKTSLVILTRQKKRPAGRKSLSKESPSL